MEVENELDRGFSRRVLVGGSIGALFQRDTDDRRPESPSFGGRTGADTPSPPHEILGHRSLSLAVEALECVLGTASQHRIVA